MIHNEKTSLTHRGYVIPKINFSDKELLNLKQKLTVKPELGDFEDENNVDNIEFPVFYESNTKIYIPRYYGIKKYGQPDKIKFTGVTREFDFNSKLRDYQIDIVNKCYDLILNSGGGLLSVGCGRGKTVMAIYLAHKLKSKTLVVVHKTFLQDQWVERIKQFTNAKIGIIRQKIIDIEDKDIVIAMIQSISMRDYDLKIFNDFKFVIYDEAHHCASKIFSKALFKTGANYTLALSATPDRSDKLKKVMDWYLGSTLYLEKRRSNNQILVKIFNYNTDDKLFSEKTIYNMKTKSQKPHIPTMINNLVEIEERNTHILNIIAQLRKFPERKILVLSGRRDHLKLLKDTVDKQIKCDVDNNLIEENECKTYFYFGGMKEKDRKIAEQHSDILFATYDMAHEGLDIDRLNTVILATPKKNIIQSVGRIMRKILETGDLRPIIIDFSDELSVFKNHRKRRVKDYKDSQYNINNYYLNKNEFISYKTYLKTFKHFTDDELNTYKNIDSVPTLDIILNDDNDDHKVNSNINENIDDIIEKNNIKIKENKINFSTYLF
jgi:superfamily II DNA or RNA helicase